MKTVRVPLPDNVAQFLDRMVDRGLFESKEAAILFAVTGFIEDPLAMLAAHMTPEELARTLVGRAGPQPKRPKPAAKGAPLQIYQLKITLQGTKPPVWRRFQTRSDTKLTRLHSMLLDIMGWSGYHLYEFGVDGLHYTGPEELEEDIYDRGLQDGSKVQLSQVMSEVGDKIVYVYDFGDGWQHAIKLEKILDPVPGENYPICLAGARNCPPEDCGGPGGYADLLKTLADPSDPEHEQMKEWVGPHYDPERFLLELVNRDLWRRVVVKKI